MVRFEIKTAGELEPAETAVWSQILATRNEAPSPYLTPEFFQAVARVRASARVLVGYAGMGHGRDGAVERPVLFLPFHRSGLKGLAGFGHPIGGPVSDVQGAIADLDLAEEWADPPFADRVMRAAGLSLLPLSHVPSADPVFRPVPAPASARLRTSLPSRPSA